MIFRPALAAAALALAAIALSATADDRTRLPDSASIDALAMRYVETEQRAPGIVIGVIDADGRRVIARGVSGNPARPILDGHSLFEIGSITKVFTGMLLAEMAARGEVAIDQRAATLMPEGMTLPDALADVTLVDLATHCAGLPRLPLDAAMLWRVVMRRSDPYAGSTVSTVFDSIARMPASQIGARGDFAYSNLGSAWLGQLLAARAGTRYGALLDTRVLGPLGLDEAWLMIPDHAAARRVVGHRDDGRAVPPWRLDAYDPAGGLEMSVDGMLDLLDHALARDWPPLVESLARHATRDDEGREIGLGWMRRVRDGETLLWHNGGTGGFSSFAALVPERGVAVVVLGNSRARVDDVALAILDPSHTIAAPAAPSFVRWIALTLIAALALAALLLLRRVLRRPPDRGLDRISIAAELGTMAFLAALIWAVSWRGIPHPLPFAALAFGAFATAVALARVPALPTSVGSRAVATLKVVGAALGFAIAALMMISAA